MYVHKFKYLYLCQQYFQVKLLFYIRIQSLHTFIFSKSLKRKFIPKSSQKKHRIYLIFFFDNEIFDHVEGSMFVGLAASKCDCRPSDLGADSQVRPMSFSYKNLLIAARSLEISCILHPYLQQHVKPFNKFKLRI